MSPKKHREEAPVPGLGTIEEQLADRVAEALISQVSPLWDRHDLLVTAANLARVGNHNTTAIANKVFAHLSPHLGEPQQRSRWRLRGWLPRAVMPGTAANHIGCNNLQMHAIL
jgi:hypothetical protein